MIDLNTLNTEQRNAVMHTDGPLMILAGAGTGKTRVITFRIAYMLGSGINPNQIVALSFTNKAAREMAERVKDLIGERAKKVWLGTFHSFCLHILRKHSDAAGLNAQFGLADTSDQLELVRRSLEEKGWSGLYKVDVLHSQIGKAKNLLLSPDEIAMHNGLIQGFSAGVDQAILAEVFRLYERQLKLHRVIDFDDCIYKTVKLLQENADVRQSCRQSFRYLMVDEYQDTNLAQLKVLELLASDTHDVCVVGDDDQSIYSWRGAMYEVLEKFEELFPKTKVIKLEQNYRCTNIILDAANKVIRNNQKRKDKTLWSASEGKIPINLLPCADDEEEAKYLAEKCISLMGSGLEPKEIAVLYRANSQARAFEFALREARVPAKTYGGQSFFERKEIKDFICYLRLILNNEDRLALLRVINSPHRGIGLKTLEKIESQANSLQKSPFLVLKDFDYHATKNFVLLVEQLSQLPRETPEDFFALGQAIIKLTGMDQEIKNKTDNVAVRERKLQNLRTMPQWIQSLTQSLFKEHGHLSTRTILDVLTLDNDRKLEDEKSGNHVSLMTIHAAKGLEFPAVFLVGLEEELLPHKNSIIDPNAICEERRLFYVAITRAKARLFLSHCVERQSGFQGKTLRQPSRFIKELPKDSVSHDGVAGKVLDKISDRDEQKSKITQRLGSIRASLQTMRIN